MWIEWADKYAYVSCVYFGLQMHLGKCWRGHALGIFANAFLSQTLPSHPTRAMIKCHDRCWLAQQRMHAYYVMHRWPHPHFARGVASAMRTCQILGVGSKINQVRKCLLQDSFLRRRRTTYFSSFSWSETLASGRRAYSSDTPTTLSIRPSYQP